MLISVDLPAPVDPSSTAVFAASEDPDRLVPLVYRPQDIMVAVSGDPLRTNAYVFAHNGILGFPTTKPIRLPTAWRALLAEASAHQEVVVQETKVAELEAHREEQRLQASIRKPADAKAYQEVTLAKAARDAVKKEALRRAGIGYEEIVGGHHTPAELRRGGAGLAEQEDPAVPVIAPVLEKLCRQRGVGLGEAVLVEGPAQRLFGHPSWRAARSMLTWLASARACSVAVRSWRNRVPSAIEARPRRRTRSLAVVPAKMPVWSWWAWGPCKAASRHGPRTPQPAQMALAAAVWGTCPDSGKKSSGSTSRQAASSRQSRSPALRGTGGDGLASCWLVLATRSASSGWPAWRRSCQVTWRT